MATNSSFPPPITARLEGTQNGRVLIYIYDRFKTPCVGNDTRRKNDKVTRGNPGETGCRGNSTSKTRNVELEGNLCSKSQNDEGNLVLRKRILREGNLSNPKICISAKTGNCLHALQIRKNLCYKLIHVVNLLTNFSLENSPKRQRVGEPWQSDVKTWLQDKGVMHPSKILTYIHSSPIENFTKAGKEGMFFCATVEVRKTLKEKLALCGEVCGVKISKLVKIGKPQQAAPPSIRWKPRGQG
jgi:hypothetical protein